MQGAQESVGCLPSHTQNPSFSQAYLIAPVKRILVYPVQLTIRVYLHSFRRRSQELTLEGYKFWLLWKATFSGRQQTISTIYPTWPYALHALQLPLGKRAVINAASVRFQLHANQLSGPACLPTNL